MELRRFFVDKITDTPCLTGEEHKHLSVVLRGKVGEKVVLCCGDGYDYICAVKEITRNETVLTLIGKQENQGEPNIEVTLFMSIMKGDKNDLVVQKATELGASHIFPMLTKYVQAFERNIKTERLNKIAAEAAKQCGRSVLTRVHDCINIKELPDMLEKFDLIVFPYEKAEKVSLKKFLTENKSVDIKKIAIVIGSEGGFAEEEVSLLQNEGVTPVTLGKRIMRAETANIAVLSSVMYELEQWQ